MLASIGKIVLPALYVIGAIASFFKRRHRQALVASTRAHNGVRALLELSWKDFERLTCEAFKERGFRVTERDFAEGRNIELLDGTRLLEIFGANLHTSAPPAKESQAPACGEPMVSRRAQRGANAGQQFWGCSTYPKCRGTRPI